MFVLSMNPIFLSSHMTFRIEFTSGTLSQNLSSLDVIEETATEVFPSVSMMLWRARFIILPATLHV